MMSLLVVGKSTTDIVTCYPLLFLNPPLLYIITPNLMITFFFISLKISNFKSHTFNYFSNLKTLLSIIKNII